jgi:hypothetical protein
MLGENMFFMLLLPWGEVGGDEGVIAGVKALYPTGSIFYLALLISS